MNEIDPQERLLKFKRDMEKLGLAPVKTEEYVSPLTDANMRVKGAATSADVTPINTLVKGSGQLPEAKTTIKGVTDKIDTMTPIKTIKNVTDKIDTKSIQKQISGNAFADKIQAILKSRAAAKASGIAGDMIKKVPMIGGIAAGLGTLLTTGDASAASQAALPLVGDSDDLGPSAGSLESKLESGTITPDEMQKLLQGLK